jgi:hypothetical protein
MALKKLNIFLLKRFSAMMQRLIATQMRMRNRKRAKAFLPRKPASDPFLLVDVMGRSGFDLTDQI